MRKHHLKHEFNDSVWLVTNDVLIERSRSNSPDHLCQNKENGNVHDKGNVTNNSDKKRHRRRWQERQERQTADIERRLKREPVFMTLRLSEHRYWQWSPVLCRFTMENLQQCCYNEPLSAMLLEVYLFDQGIIDSRHMMTSCTEEQLIETMRPDCFDFVLTHLSKCEILVVPVIIDRHLVSVVASRGLRCVRILDSDPCQETQGRLEDIGGIIGTAIKGPLGIEGDVSVHFAVCPRQEQGTNDCGIYQISFICRLFSDTSTFGDVWDEIATNKKTDIGKIRDALAVMVAETFVVPKKRILKRREPMGADYLNGAPNNPIGCKRLVWSLRGSAHNSGDGHQRPQLLGLRIEIPRRRSEKILRHDNERRIGVKGRDTNGDQVTAPSSFIYNFLREGSTAAPISNCSLESSLPKIRDEVFEKIVMKLTLNGVDRKYAR